MNAALSMTEDFISPSQPAPEIARAPQSLRQAREAAGLQVAALAAMLKVPVDRLQALEDGRYHELPNLTFTRALASSVCRVLKIDPASVLQTLPQQVEVKLGTGQPLESGHFGTSRRSFMPGMPALSWRSPLVWALLVLVLAVALWWWLPQREVVLSSAETAVPEQESAVVETVLPADQQPLDAAQQALPAVNEPVAVTPVASTEPAVAQPVPVQAAPAVPAPAAEKPVASVLANPVPALAAAGQPLVQLRARATTWIQLKDAAGKELQQRTLQPGQTLDYDGAMPLQVVLGRANGVEVIVRGQVFDTSAYAANKVARFEVK